MVTGGQNLEERKDGAEKDSEVCGSISTKILVSRHKRGSIFSEKGVGRGRGLGGVVHSTSVEFEANKGEAPPTPLHPTNFTTASRHPFGPSHHRRLSYH